MYDAWETLCRATRFQPAGYWQAYRLGPDGRRACEPIRLSSQEAARAWLDETAPERDRGSWVDPGVSHQRFDAFATRGW